MVMQTGINCMEVECMPMFSCFSYVVGVKPGGVAVLNKNDRFIYYLVSNLEVCKVGSGV